MTNQEFNYQIKLIETEYRQAKRKLYIDYTTAQRKFKKGDIIRDSVGNIIQVKDFGFDIYFGVPRPTYIGIELRKDLLQKKKTTMCEIYGNEGVVVLKYANKQNH
jgi:hypothetical protein